MRSTNNSKGNILVVDDMPANLRLLSGMLSEQHYKVRPAPSGESALRLEEGEIEEQGLGLSIVKRIVEILDGKVGLMSRPGEGSTFWFTLPQTNE